MQVLTVPNSAMKLFNEYHHSLSEKLSCEDLPDEFEDTISSIFVRCFEVTLERYIGAGGTFDNVYSCEFGDLIEGLVVDELADDGEIIDEVLIAIAATDDVFAWPHTMELIELDTMVDSPTYVDEIMLALGRDITISMYYGTAFSKVIKDIEKFEGKRKLNGYRSRVLKDVEDFECTFVTSRNEIEID